MPLVVKLKMSPLHVDVIVRISTARTTSRRETSRGRMLRRAGGASSGATKRQKRMPKAMLMSPGTTKAARQPKYFTSSPVMTAAAAMPRLPTRPLTPITVPGRFVCWTSIGMPTG